MNAVPLPEEALTAVLKKYFGYETFRGLQSDIIHALLNHQDLLVLMPTGGGKSLCYQIPALVRKGLTIVVSPLIALMEDQVYALQSQGISAAYYNSSLNQEESRRVLSALHQQQLDLLYIAPERLVNPAFLERLNHCQVTLFAIDEAHCISQWGHDFRPEYAELGKLKQHFPTIPIIALTATADQQTRKDIIDKLRYQPKTFIASFNRPNIHYRVIAKDNPLKQVLFFLSKHKTYAGIIYCGTRHTVDQLTEKLRANHINAAAYHAGLSYETRREVQSAFRHESVDVVVATLAFGMGIDKPNIRFVIHYDLPKTIEGYYQETGRAGRDGLPAEALLLYNPGDSARLRNWAYAITDEHQQRIELAKLNHMVAFAEADHCRRRILLRYFDETNDVDCAYCDICDNPPQRQDSTTDAQKFLSCIYRLKQNYGMTYVIDVLRGSSSQKINQAGHHQLSTYGIGSNQSLAYWRHLAWQLIHQDYCQQDAMHFNVLKLSPKAIDVLKGKTTVMLVFRPQALIEPPKEKEALSTPDASLFDALRRLRRQLADEENKPPFMVFSDNSLIDMVRKKPQTLADFLTITGVGQQKLAHYGTPFLTLIRQFSHNETCVQ